MENKEGFGVYKTSETTFSVAGFTGSVGTGLGTTSTTFSFLNQWTDPKLVDTIINEDSIEQVFTEVSLIYQGFTNTEARRVFKVRYSCVDGKWNKSEKIYGHISPAQSESYAFDEE